MAKEKLPVFSFINGDDIRPIAYELKLETG